MSKSDLTSRGSYAHIFIYRIPHTNHDAMVDLQIQLTQIYRKHGTLSSEFHELAATTVFEGFIGLDKAIGAHDGEEVWVELDTYQDVEQFKRVVAAIGADEKSGPLFGQLYGLASQGYSIVMGEFDRLKLITQSRDMNPRIIKKELVLKASLSEVWEAWTSAEGAKTFFAPGAKIELRIGGPYEVYFNLEESHGLRGGEGCVVLSYLPMEMLSFSWNAPPSIPSIRNKGEKTWVVLSLGELDGGRVKVSLSHVITQQGEDWDKYYDYFAPAWDIIMGRLALRFSSGPLDWTLPREELNSAGFRELEKTRRESDSASN